jgi:hypothetical protein
MIAELNEVTSAVRVTNPVAAQLDALSKIALRARSLFRDEKTEHSVDDTG